MEQEIIRNKSALPGAFPGLKIESKLAVNLDTDATQSLIVETGCQHIIYAVGIKWVTADNSLPLAVPPVIEASTTFVGTKKVTFAIPALSTLHFIIIGSEEAPNAVDLPNNGGDVTVVLFEQ